MNLSFSPQIGICVACIIRHLGCTAQRAALAGIGATLMALAALLVAGPTIRPFSRRGVALVGTPLLLLLLAVCVCAFIARDSQTPAGSSGTAPESSSPPSPVTPALHAGAAGR